MIRPKLLLFVVLTNVLTINAQSNVNVLIYPSVNKFEESIYVEVIQEDSLYHYKYSIYNDNTSEQNISSFRVFTNASNIILEKPVNWGGSYNRKIKRVLWMGKGASTDIKPGEFLSGYKIISRFPPGICKYYMKAFLGFPVVSGDPEIIKNGSLEESAKQGYTLGPASYSDPFIPSAFADTIRSYISRSFTLDWTDSKSILDKYFDLMSSVISEISQENIFNAKLILEQVLAEVETDSGNGLTSEAYALIKYNSKHLYDQLQDSEVSIEDLIAYINKAQSEGTIDNSGVANSLISKLETAQKQLEKEKPKQAVNALNAFLNELEAQHEKHIAEEVYTYLKEKVEGLVAQLEE